MECRLGFSDLDRGDRRHTIWGMTKAVEVSPLRYPGGKGSLARYFEALLSAQTKPCEVFVEPFAGGAGAALRLLVDGTTKSIVLNDLDPAIAAMWRAIVTQNDDFARLVESAPVTIDAWHEHRAIHAQRRELRDDLALGFATFFLNRTNRSGIVGARPIGGLAQAGAWTLDARYNRQTLASRIRLIGRFADRITVTQKNGADVVKDVDRVGTFIYADPPYLVKGSDLYLNTMSWEDHQTLAAAFGQTGARWLVTYDHDDRVHELYPSFRRAEFSIAHTVAKPHVGKEFAVFGDSVFVPSLEWLGHGATFVT